MLPNKNTLWGLRNTSLARCNDALFKMPCAFYDLADTEARWELTT